MQSGPYSKEVYGVTVKPCKIFKKLFPICCMHKMRLIGNSEVHVASILDYVTSVVKTGCMDGSYKHYDTSKSSFKQLTYDEKYVGVE